MPKEETVKYTLVRHTGYSVGGDYAFERAVELRAVTLKESVVIAKMGGILRESYTDIRELEEDYNYGPGNCGMIPHAKGRFTKRFGFDEEIFIPKNPISNNRVVPDEEQEE